MRSGNPFPHSNQAFRIRPESSFDAVRTAAATVLLINVRPAPSPPVIDDQQPTDGQCHRPAAWDRPGTAGTARHGTACQPAGRRHRHRYGTDVCRSCTSSSSSRILPVIISVIIIIIVIVIVVMVVISVRRTQRQRRVGAMTDCDRRRHCCMSVRHAHCAINQHGCRVPLPSMTQRCLPLHRPDISIPPNHLSVSRSLNIISI